MTPGLARPDHTRIALPYRQPVRRRCRGLEHEGRHYTIVRHGKAVAHLEPVSKGRGSDVKAMLLKHGADESWARELTELRGLIEIDDRS